MRISSTNDLISQQGGGAICRPVWAWKGCDNS
nr:MAG TPA: hypothetical protein [Caudoviricetes sp.]DAG18025.1 MAG TPA: hypothetical protein [Caudoviricetes sp.]